jgi:hypothetical protein
MFAFWILVCIFFATGLAATFLLSSESEPRLTETKQGCCSGDGLHLKYLSIISSMYYLLFRLSKLQITLGLNII